MAVPTVQLLTSLAPAAIGGNPSGGTAPQCRVRYQIQAAQQGQAGGGVTIGNSGAASPDLQTDTISTSPIGIFLRQNLLASDLDMPSYLKNHRNFDYSIFATKAYQATVGTDYMLWQVQMMPTGAGPLASFLVIPPTAGGVAELELVYLYDSID